MELRDQTIEVQICCIQPFNANVATNIKWQAKIICNFEHVSNTISREQVIIYAISNSKYAKEKNNYFCGNKQHILIFSLVLESKCSAVYRITQSHSDNNFYCIAPILVRELSTIYSLVAITISLKLFTYVCYRYKPTAVYIENKKVFGLRSIVLNIELFISVR